VEKDPTLGEPVVKEANDDDKKKNAEVASNIKLLLAEIDGGVGFERGTVWLVDNVRGKLWAVGASQLGNTTFSIGLKTGLAGAAATSGDDTFSQDMAADDKHAAQADQETGYVAKQTVCAVLDDNQGGDGAFRVVVQVSSSWRCSDATVTSPSPARRASAQLLNKKDDTDGGGFTAEHAEKVRARKAEIIEAARQYRIPRSGAKPKGASAAPATAKPDGETMKA
jgi:hypothetical protein